MDAIYVDAYNRKFGDQYTLANRPINIRLPQSTGFYTDIDPCLDINVETDQCIISDNNSLRGELKKVFTFDEVIKFNKNNKNTLKQNKYKSNSVLKIFVNEDFTKDKLTELKLTSGHHKVEIIINNQTVKIPGDFEVNQEMLKLLKTMNGVVEISFNEEIH